MKPGTDAAAADGDLPLAPRASSPSSSGSGPASKSWKDSSGRVSGAAGYQFGDLSRCMLHNSGSGIKKWANHKGESGYRFGDIFLKDFVKMVVGANDASGAGPAADATDDGDEEESAEHKQIAANLRATRQKILELLEEHLPRIEQRLKELESKKDLNAMEASEVYRLKVGSPNAVMPPLDTYRQCLEEVRNSFEVQLNGTLVRIAKEGGELEVIESSLGAMIGIAEKVENCANDLCSPLQTNGASAESARAESNLVLISAEEVDH